ncbi:hypothetical protein NBRC116494_15410 [Aurantivibrio plasticivorans]
MKALKLSVVFVACIASITACRGVDTKDTRNDGQGEVSVYISSSPIDDRNRVDSVNLLITALRVTPTGGVPIDIDIEPDIAVNLMGLENGETERLLDEYSLDIDNYESVELVLSSFDNNVEFENQMFDLSVKAGFENNLTSNVNFEIEDDSEYEITINIDLYKSLQEDASVDPQVYYLLPALRLVRNERSATITGQVDNALPEDSSCDDNGVGDDEGNAVYAFLGAGVTFQDIQQNSGDPYAVASVIKSTTGYTYSLYNLEPGTYTLFFTCDGKLDELQADNESIMARSDAEEIQVGSGEIETVNFID